MSVQETCRRNRLMQFGAAVLATALGLIAGDVHGQTWNNFNSGVWNLNTNWLGNVTPVSSNATILTFSSTPPQLPPGSPFQPTGNYTATNDFATPFTLNQMVFTGTGASDVASNGIVITSSVAGGGILFDGANPRITQNGTGSVAFANGAATADLQINSNGLLIDGSGSGHLNLNGVITGTGNITVSQTGASPMNSGGQIFLAPGAANTFVGNVILNNGNLTLNTTNSPIGAAATNALVINGGTVRGSTAFALANNITLNSQMRVVGIVAPTLTGVISGNGGIWHNPSAGVNLTVQNTISGTGAIVVDPTGLFSPTMTLSSTATLNGTAVNASSYTINGGSILSLTNATATATRLNAAAGLTLNSSNFTLISGSAAPTLETVASTTISGNPAFTLTPVTTQPLRFNGGTLTRNQSSTFQVSTLGTGLSLGNAPGTNGNANLFFSNLGAGDNVNGVMPFAAAIVQDGATTAGTFVRYDVANGVVPLNRTTDYVQNLAVAPFQPVNLPTSNYRVGTTGIGSTNYGAFNNNISVNAYLHETTTASGLIGGSLYGTGTLSLTSGTLATTLVGGGTQPTYLGTTITKNIALGSVQGNFHTQAFAAALGNITGTSGLVKSGAGQLWLLGDNSGLSGGLTVNGAAILFTRDQNLGAPGAGITLGTGTATSQLQFVPASHFEAADTASVTINRPLLLADNGAGLLAANVQNTTMNYSGQISGSGRLVKSFLGLVNLTNPMNNYTGDTAILQGSLGVTSDGNLGAASSNITLQSASTGAGAGMLLANSSFATSRNILITSTTALGNGINVNSGVTLTMDGHIGGNQTGIPFLKVGEGNLILTANNTVNGLVTVGDATPTRRPGGLYAQPGGTITLSGANGALSAATAFVLTNGTTVHLDNSAAINQNRITSKQITLNGAELQMTGNASGDVFEHVGVSSTAGLTNGTLGNTITLNQPASGGPGLSTTLVATGYQTSTASGITFFRGTNLGGAVGDRTAMIFVASPALTNGLMPQSLYADSPTANPQDFATLTAGSVQRFTGYLPLPATGGLATETYTHSGPLALTGAVTGNSLKLTNGNVDLAGFNLTFGGANMLLSTGVDSIITGSGTPAVAFGTSAARISVNNSLSIGSLANPVSVTSSGGLHKFGPGTLELSAANVSGGGYAVSGGTLRLLAPAAFTSGQIITMQPGTTLDLNNSGTVATPVGIAALAGYGTVNIGSGALALGASAQSFGGSLVGNGTLLNTGTSTQTLNGNSPLFSGGVQILAGGLSIDSNVVPSDAVNPGALGTGTSPIQFGNSTGTAAATLSIGTNATRFDRDIVVPSGVPNTTLFTLTTVAARVTTMASNITLGREIRIDGAFSSTAHVAGTTTITGNITESAPGVGSIDWFGANINLWGNNSFSGRFFVNNGNGNTVGMGTDTALGTGVIQVDNSTTFVGNLRADNGARTLANNFSFDAGASFLGFTGRNNMTFNGTVDLTNGARTWQVTNTGVTTFANTMSESGGVANIVKTGGGTLVLNGANTFTGGVAVNGGRLLVNNTLGSGTGTGAVTVNSSGSLGGSGTIAGAVTVNGGGLLAPGNSPGVLTLGSNLTFTGGTFEVELQGTGPGQFDQVVITGAGNVALGAGVASISVLPSGYTPSLTDVFVVINNTGTGTLSGTFAGFPDQSIVMSNVLGSGIDYFIFYGSFAGFPTSVVISPVPEPATVLGICAVGFGAVRVIRRRFKKTTTAA